MVTGRGPGEAPGVALGTATQRSSSKCFTVRPAVVATRGAGVFQASGGETESLEGLGAHRTLNTRATACPSRVTVTSQFLF